MNRSGTESWKVIQYSSLLFLYIDKSFWLQWQWLFLKAFDFIREEISKQISCLSKSQLVKATILLLQIHTPILFHCGNN